MKFDIRKITPTKFVIFSFITFGIFTSLYSYQLYRIHKEKFDSDFSAVLYSVFIGFFIGNLAGKLNDITKDSDNHTNYKQNPILLFIIYFGVVILSNLPNMYALLLVVWLPYYPIAESFYKFSQENKEYDVKSTQLDFGFWMLLTIAVIIFCVGFVFG